MTMKIIVGVMSGTETQSDTASTAAMATSRNEATVEADEVAVGAQVQAGEAGRDRPDLRVGTVIIITTAMMNEAVMLGTPPLQNARIAGIKTMDRGTNHHPIAFRVLA